MSKDTPSEAERLELAKSLCSEASWMVAIQVRRIRSEEPEDKEFVFRFWGDLQFLIVALRRLRKAASIADFLADVRTATSKFDRALPGLAQMRNVGEHIESYAIDSSSRHHQKVGRRDIESGSWNGVTFKWLGHRLNIDNALIEANTLFAVVRAAKLPV